MKHTKEEILNALQIIKDECRMTACEDCPFGDCTKSYPFTRCRLQQRNPSQWKIAEREEVWKVLE